LNDEVKKFRKKAKPIVSAASSNKGAAADNSYSFKLDFSKAGIYYGLIMSEILNKPKCKRNDYRRKKQSYHSP